MATVALPATLAELFPGCARRVEASGASVRAVIDDLDARWPGLRYRIVEGEGAAARARPHLRLFVDGQLGDLDTPVGEGSLVHVLLAISGG